MKSMFPNQSEQRNVTYTLLLVLQFEFQEIVKLHWIETAG